MVKKKKHPSERRIKKKFKKFKKFKKCFRKFRRKYVFSALVILLIILSAVFLWQIICRTGIFSEIFSGKFESASQLVEPPSLPGEKLGEARRYTATFSDSFSGQAWLDEPQTNLYFDWTSTNLLFPPAIAIKEIFGPDFLAHFVPVRVVPGEEITLFLGRDRLTEQRQILLWQSSENEWSNFAIPGQFPAEENIIDFFYQGKDSWLIFSQKEKKLRLDILRVLSEESGWQIEIEPVQGQPEISSLNKIRVVCAEQTCLVSTADPIKFWQLSVEPISRSITESRFLENLTTVFQRKAPDELFMFSLESEGLQKWLLVWTKKTIDGLYLFGLDEVAEGNRISSLMPFQTAEYPGQLGIIPSLQDKIFLFWASYFSQAYVIDKNGQLNDLTAYFGWRISADKSFSLYNFPHSVYIKNGADSIIRWDGHINTRIDGIFQLNFNPNFLEIIPDAFETDSGCLIAGVPKGGIKIYRFKDYGFDLSQSRQAVSNKVNFSVSRIGAAQIQRLDSGGLASESGTETLSELEIYFSNNGGASWQKNQLGAITDFENSGNDLRWKIVINPKKSEKSYITPYFRSISLKYWYEK